MGDILQNLLPSLIGAGTQLGGAALANKQSKAGLEEQKREFDIQNQRRNYLLQFALPGLLTNLGYKGPMPNMGSVGSPFSDPSMGSPYTAPSGGKGILGGAATGAGLGMTFGGPLGAAIGGLGGAAVQGIRSIGAGRKTEDSFVKNFEDELGKQVLPQVIAKAQSGDLEGAKALLQQGVAKYQSGIQQYKQAGGNFAQTAAQSLANEGLQNTISTLSSQLGLSYTPGTGMATTPGAAGAQGAAAGAPSADDQARAAREGLQAPLAEGDPYSLTPAKVADAPLLNETGYDPKIQAQMKAQAMEAPAAAGLQELSQVKRSLGQSGLGSSPAGAAVKGTIARQTGQAQVAAARDASLQNANVGMENARTNVTNKLGQSNLQTQYDWAAPVMNFNERNARYAGAQRVLGGA